MTTVPRDTNNNEATPLFLLPHHHAAAGAADAEQKEKWIDINSTTRRTTVSAPPRSAKRNVVISQILAVLVSVGLLGWMGTSSLRTGRLSPSSEQQEQEQQQQQRWHPAVATTSVTSTHHSWNDAVLDEWEQFLHRRAMNMQQPLLASDLLIGFQSEAEEKVSHSKKKPDGVGEYKTKPMEGKGGPPPPRTSVDQAGHDHEVDTGTNNGGNGLTYLNSSHVFRMLRSYDGGSDDFFRYQHGWDVQVNQAYCAMATSAAVLNSYRGTISDNNNNNDGTAQPPQPEELLLPQDPSYVPYPYATQMALAQDECVRRAVVNVDAVSRVGLGLGMVPGLLNCFLNPVGYRAVGYPMDPSETTVEEMRDLVRMALLDENARVVLNYDRGGIGQGPNGHGHWSPIGAYSADTDSFLVMDVAKYKYPPVFIPSSSLFGGVTTLDTCASMMPYGGPIDWSSGNFDLILRQLGCQPGFRGFVVVRPID